jgi:lipopolysaccharide/colanic/teichoic acid biosynthesis glycosyltransferase
MRGVSASGVRLSDECPRDAGPALPTLNAESQSGLPLLMTGGFPVIANSSRTLLSLKAKRLIDIVGSLTLLIALVPLFVVVTTAILATSRGGVLFCQQREGLNGRLFSVYKFRSFHRDRCDPSGISQTFPDDPRVTSVGQFLRRTHIDELPQLLNVLKGDMSLVGPRPHVPGMRVGGQRYDALVPYYRLRLLWMKPGMTGWAQANGLRGASDDPKLARLRIDHDLAYIQNFSLGLDLKIIAKTAIGGLLRGTGMRQAL